MTSAGSWFLHTNNAMQILRERDLGTTIEANLTIFHPFCLPPNVRNGEKANGKRKEKGGK
jgi:hypothetical protein